LVEGVEHRVGHIALFSSVLHGSVGVVEGVEHRVGHIALFSSVLHGSVGVAFEI